MGDRRPIPIDDSDDRTDFERWLGPIACWGNTAAPLLEIRGRRRVRVLAGRPGC